MEDNSERVSQALALLKSELVGIREQDVDLMKQLLKIKDTIKQLSPNKENRPGQTNCNSCHVGRNGTESKSRRQRYLNHYMTQRRGSCSSSNGSLSSIEEITSSTEDCRLESESESENISGSDENLQVTSSDFPSPIYSIPYSTRQRKLSLPCDNSDEYLLISNIKVWKYKQNRSMEDLKLS